MSDEKPPMKYCIQCVDRVSQVRGDFLHTGDFRALSPVFPDICGLSRWMHENGYEYDLGKGLFVVRKASLTDRLDALHAELVPVMASMTTEQKIEAIQGVTDVLKGEGYTQKDFASALIQELSPHSTHEVI